MNLAIISMIREPWGGSEELWAAMASEALAAGDQVAHSTFNFHTVGHKEAILIGKGLKHIPRRGYISPEKPVWVRILRKGLNLLLNKVSNPFNSLFNIKPDLVIYIGTAYSIAEEKELLNLLKKSGIPYILNIQLNFEFNYPGTRAATVIREAYRGARELFFVSHRNMETAKRHLAMDIPNASVIRNPVNLQDISSVAWPADKEVQFAMVGNLLTIHKGQDIALETLSRPHWAERNWHLNIYGQGPDLEYLKQLAACYRLTDRISFHGKVTDIRAVWEKNHLLLMPSLMEGMPLAIVEAMLCARPVVATDVGGHTEWIEDGKEGFIAAAPTISSFTSALEAAWQQMDRWQEMGQAARKKALQLYDPDPGGTFYRHITRIIKNNH